jgi:hypothetical protein
MRVIVHPAIATKDLTIDDKDQIKDMVWELIYRDLENNQ